MKVRNLPVELMPQTLDEIKGQESAVLQIKRFLELDQHPFALFVAGGSGTGKNCLVHNYIKATHCLNRKPGEYRACGHCAQCKLDPRTKGKYNDVLWVQVGSSTDTINQQFKDALAEVMEPPRQASVLEPHRYYKFIVFDELQSLPTNIIEQLLSTSETKGIVGRNRVIYVLITMSEEKLTQKDPNLAKALIDRTEYIRMKTPTNGDLAYFLQTRFNVTNPAILEVLVSSAAGSYRGAIRAYDKVKHIIEAGGDADTCADLLYVVSPRKRRKLWELLQSSNITNEKLSNYVTKDLLKNCDSNDYYSLKEYWENLVEICSDKTKLLEQLLEDIDNSRLSGYQVPLEYDKLICDYLLSERSLSPWHLIKQLKGKNLVNLEIFDKYEPQDGLERRGRLG